MKYEIAIRALLLATFAGGHIAAESGTVPSATPNVEPLAVAALPNRSRLSEFKARKEARPILATLSLPLASSLPITLTRQMRDLLSCSVGYSRTTTIANVRQNREEIALCRP